MLISPYGGVRKRPGLEFLGGTKGFGRARLVRFQYSTEVSYMLELGEKYLRVWNRDGSRVPVMGEMVPAPLPDDDPRSFRQDFYRWDGTHTYRCMMDHEETSFASDLAAGKWMVWTGPLEFATPYEEEELREVQFAQINAVMYFTHPEHPPHKFRYEGVNVSHFREVEWTYPPLLDENLIDDITIEASFTLNGGASGWDPMLPTYLAGARVTYGGKTWKCNRKHAPAGGKPPGGSATTYKAVVEDALGRPTLIRKPLWTEAFADNSSTPGEVITLKSTAGIFTEEHLDAYFEISKQREVNSYEVFLRAVSENNNATSGTLVIQGGWQFSSFGSWDGIFYLERSRDRGATWEKVRSWESDKDRNVSAQGHEDERCLMRLRWMHQGNPPSTSVRPRGVLEALDGFIRGIVKISKWENESEVEAVCITPVEKCTTKYWAEGAWSKFQGHPRTVAVHEQRVIYGGTDRRSQDVWGSATDDYENFKRGTEETDAWTHSLAADQQNSIQWLLSQKQLLIGTTGGEWVLGSTKEEAGISATNVRARRHSGHGSEYLPATLVNEATLFVQRGGRKLREMVFSFEADGYVTQDLTILADHVTDGGVVDTAFQQQRDAVLWAVVSSGELIALTYERGQKVGGWGRHATAGKFESVAVLATPGEEDEVWVIVSRVTGGVERRYVERFRPDQFRAQAESDLKELFYVDAGVIAREVFPGAGLQGVEGLAHLEGKVVEVIADGHVLARRTVTGGQVVLGSGTGDPADATVIIVGLPYEAVLEPLPLEIGMQDGTSAGRTKRIYEVDIFFHQSGGCLIGDRVGGRFDVMSMREVGAPLGVAVPLFTGIKTHKLDARGEREASFVIRQESPVPLAVLGVVPKWSVSGS